MSLFKKKDKTEVIEYRVVKSENNIIGGDIQKTTFKFDYYIDAKIFMEEEAERLTKKEYVTNQKLFELKTSVLLEDGSYFKSLESKQLDTTIILILITEENETFTIKAS